MMVVVVIILILATIAFIRYGNFTTDANIAKMSSDKSNIEKVLELHKAKTGEYPDFDEEDGEEVFGPKAWSVVKYRLPELPVDPFTKKYYKIKFIPIGKNGKIALVDLGDENNINKDSSTSLDQNNKSIDVEKIDSNKKIDIKSANYIISMENGRCKEGYLEYNGKCRKIGEMKLVYDLNQDKLKVKIPFDYGLSKFSFIDWGDNGENNCPTSGDNNVSCTYAKKGVYTIIVKGYADHLRGWYNHVDSGNRRIIEISDWNALGVTSLENAFPEAEVFNQAIGEFDVSNITDMSYMFKGAKKFNQPLNNWNVSNVKSMQYMFNGAEEFNQPLNNWNVSKVINMYSMFNNARTFNQPLNNWNVSNVRTMSYMFDTASKFNQPLNNWNVNKVTSFHNFSHHSGLSKENIPEKFRK